MARKKQLAGWLALPLVIAHLLLTGMAVPHCHAAVVGAGRQGAPEQPFPSARPHRHWAGAGHSHHDAGHAHGRSEHEDHGGYGRSEPPEHDSDVIYLADAFGAALAGPREYAPDLVTAWVALPHTATTPLPAAARHVRDAVRPPGDRLSSHHDLLPHVLRI
jgi:hypothetical protein